MCWFFLSVHLHKNLFCFVLFWNPLWILSHTHTLCHTQMQCFPGGREEGWGGWGWSGATGTIPVILSAERLSITALLSARCSVLLLAVAAPRLSCFALLSAAAAAAHLSYLPPSLSELRRLKLVLLEGVWSSRCWAPADSQTDWDGGSAQQFRCR